MTSPLIMTYPHALRFHFVSQLAKKLSNPQLNKLDTRRNTLLPGSDDADALSKKVTRVLPGGSFSADLRTLLFDMMRNLYPNPNRWCSFYSETEKKIDQAEITANLQVLHVL